MSSALISACSGAHVGGRADELVQLGVNREVGQAALGGLGDAEVNDLGHRSAVMQRDKDVRGLMSRWMDMPLMRVLYGVADPMNRSRRSRAALVLVAVIRDFDAANQLHQQGGRSPVAPASRTLAMFGWSIMASASRLASNRRDIPRIHAPADDLERNAAADGFGLLGDVHEPQPPSPRFSRIL